MSSDDRHPRRQRRLAEYAMSEAVCLEPLFLPGLASFFCAVHPIGPSKTIFLMKVNPTMIGDLRRVTTGKLGESSCGRDLANQPRTVDLLRRLYTSDVHPWRDFVDDAIKDATFVYKARYPMPALYDYLQMKQAKAKQERRSDAAAEARMHDSPPHMHKQEATGTADGGEAIVSHRKATKRKRRPEKSKQEEPRRCYYGDLPPPWSDRHGDWKEYALPDEVIGDYTFLAKEIVIYKRLAAAWLETRRQQEAEIDQIDGDVCPPLVTEDETTNMYFFAQLYGVDLCPKTGVTRGVILGNHSDTQVDESGLLLLPDHGLGACNNGEARTESADTSVADAIRYASQITFALAQTHLCGIAHLDIKPENILDVNKHYLSTLDKCFPPMIDRDYEGEDRDAHALSSSDFHTRVCKLIDFDAAAFVAPTAIMKVNHFETAVSSARRPKVIKGYANRNILTSHRYIPRYNVFGTDNFIAPERLIEDDDAFNAHAYDIFAFGATIGSFMLNNSFEKGRGAYLFDCPPNYSAWREHADQMAFIGESQYPMHWRLSPSLAFGWISSSNYTPLDKFGAAGEGLGNISSTYSSFSVLPPTLLPERTKLPEVWNSSLLHCRKCADESGWNRFLDTLEDARQKAKTVPVMDAAASSSEITSYSSRARRRRRLQKSDRHTSVFASSMPAAHISESRMKKRSKLIVTEALETQTPADRGNTVIDAGDWLGVKRFIDLNQNIATYSRLGSTTHISNDAEWMETSVTGGLPSLGDIDDADVNRRLASPLCPSCNKYRRGPLRLWEMFVMMDTLMQAAPILLARLRAAPDEHNLFEGICEEERLYHHRDQSPNQQPLIDVSSSDLVDAMNSAIMLGEDSMTVRVSSMTDSIPSGSYFDNHHSAADFVTPKTEVMTNKFGALCERLPVPQFAKDLVDILSAIVDAATVEHRFGSTSEKSFRWVQWFQMSSLDDIVVSCHYQIEQWWSSVCQFMADIESKHDALEQTHGEPETGSAGDRGQDDGSFIVSATHQFFYRIVSIVFGASSMVRHCTGYLATTRPDAVTLLCKDVPAVVAASSDVIYAPSSLSSSSTNIHASSVVAHREEERRRGAADEAAERAGHGYFGIHRIGFFNCVSHTTYSRVLFPDEDMMKRCTGGRRLSTAPSPIDDASTFSAAESDTLQALKKSVFLLQEEIAFRFWKFARSLPDSVQLKILGRRAGNLYSRVLDQSSLQPGVLYGLELFKMLWQEEFESFWINYVKHHYHEDVAACKSVSLDPSDASHLQRSSKSVYQLVVNFSFVIVSCLVHASQVFMSEASPDMDMISFIFHQFMVQTASAQFDDAVHSGGKWCVLSLGDLSFFRNAHLGGSTTAHAVSDVSTSPSVASVSYSSYVRNRKNAHFASSTPPLHHAGKSSAMMGDTTKTERFNLKSTSFWLRRVAKSVKESQTDSANNKSSRSRHPITGRRLFRESSSSASIASSPTTADTKSYPTGVTRLVFSDVFDKSGDAEVHIPSFRSETIVVHFEESLEELQEYASLSDGEDESSDDDDDDDDDKSVEDVDWIGPHKARSVFFQHLLDEASANRHDIEYAQKKTSIEEDGAVKALRSALLTNNPHQGDVATSSASATASTKDVADTCNVVVLDDAKDMVGGALHQDQDEVFDLKRAEGQLMAKMSRLTTSRAGPFGGRSTYAALAAVDVSGIKSSSHKLPTVNYKDDDDDDESDEYSGSDNDDDESGNILEDDRTSSSAWSDEVDESPPSSLSSKKNQVVLEMLRPELFKRFGASYFKAKNTLDIAISQRCRGSYPLPRLLIWYEGLAAYMPLNEQQARILRKLINQWYCVSIDASVEYSSVTLFMVMVYCCTRIVTPTKPHNGPTKDELPKYAPPPSNTRHHPQECPSVQPFTDWALETIVHVLADSAPVHPVKDVGEKDDATHASKVIECLHLDTVPMFMDLVRMMIARID